MKDPKFTTTATGKSSHHACTLDNASVGVKYLFLQLYYQQVALVIKEEFYKRNVLWRKAYVPDLFFPPDMQTRMKAVEIGGKEKE